MGPRNMGRYQLPNFTKTSKPPRRPYEKERLDAELKLLGQFGLKNKREIWRVRLILSKTRATARNLLTKDEKDPKRIFEGQALMRRMIRYGILDEDKQRLDYLLNLKVENIRQRHIRVGRQIVNVPSFMVRVESQAHIEFALNSPLGNGRPGRVKRRNAANGGGDAEDDE